MSHDVNKINSKPDYGSEIAVENVITPPYQVFFDDTESTINDLVEIVEEENAKTQVDLISYIVAGLPLVTATPGLIYVSDETGGAIPAFSDGVNWRRVTDRAIVS